jgi:hypothetical protein
MTGVVTSTRGVFDFSLHHIGVVDFGAIIILSSVQGAEISRDSFDYIYIRTNAIGGCNRKTIFEGRFLKRTPNVRFGCTASESRHVLPSFSSSRMGG